MHPRDIDDFQPVVDRLPVAVETATVRKAHDATMASIAGFMLVVYAILVIH